MWIFIVMLIIFLQILSGQMIMAIPIMKGVSYQEYHLPARPSTQWENPHFKPYFDPINNQQNITAQLGKSTFLVCKIRQITDESVSWVKQRDLSIISAGEYIFSSDNRFRATHVDNTDKWALHIDYVQKDDEGVYECQVSSEPKISLPFYLKVIEANAEILGKNVIYHKQGNTLNLTCIINQSAAPPRFIYWQHENKVLNFVDTNTHKIKISDNLDQLRDLYTTASISSADENLNNDFQINHYHLHNHNSKLNDHQYYNSYISQSYNQNNEPNQQPLFISHLIIYDLKPADAGNYSCKPIPQYADAANVTINVLNGENPAAMQHSNQLRIIGFNWIIVLIIHFFIKHNIQP